MTPLKTFKPKRKIKAVFWDVDGTLVQTEDLHRDATIEIFKRYGATFGHDDFAALHGRSLKNNFETIQEKFNLKDLTADSFYEQKCAYFDSRIDKIDMTTPHLRTILQKILDTGCAQAAVSNGVRHTVDIGLRVVGTHFFEFSLAIEDTITGKPSPVPYLMAAERLKLHPEECLVIEDSGAGIESGVAAGMNVIACPFFKDMLLKHKESFDKADLLVDTLESVDWDAILA